MWQESRSRASALTRAVLGSLTLLLASCSKPEEVVASRVALANQALDGGDAARAISILEALDKRHPKQPAVHEALGFAYARAGRPGAAAESFVAAADLDPAATGLRQLAAEAFLKDGSAERAAAQHRIYLGEFPGDFQSWQKLGEIEEARGNVARAIDAYLEWYRIRPNGECAFRLGVAFRKLNNQPQTKTWYEATIKHGEAHVDDALLGLLELEVETGNLAAAERTVGQLDTNFPGILDASALAGVRQRIAAWKEAEKALEAARGEQQRLARELELARREREAELAAARPPEQPAPPPAAPPVEPDRPTPSLATPLPRSPSQSPQLRAAVERREAGDLAGAIEILWRALGEDDSKVDLWIELADAHLQLGDHGPAEACILEARRRSPESIEVETAYLNIVRATQDSETYLTRVEAARRRFPADANLAWVHAVELAAREGETVRAISAHEDFLLLADPADPRRADANGYLARARR